MKLRGVTCNSRAPLGTDFAFGGGWRRLNSEVVSSAVPLFLGDTIEYLRGGGCSKIPNF